MSAESERQLPGIDQAAAHQLLPGRHHQLPFILEQTRIEPAIMESGLQNAASTLPVATAANWSSTEVHPFDIDLELALEMPDKGQGVFIKTATEGNRSVGGLSGQGQSSCSRQGGAEGRQRVPPEAKFLAGASTEPTYCSYEELPPTAPPMNL
jgi:hypothetical protein